MKNRWHNSLISARVFSQEAGEALILVLIFLLVGSLVLLPALHLVGTALKTGRGYEGKTNELHAADAGVDDAVWRIKYNGLEALFENANYNYMFTTNATYDIEDPINDLTTNVTIGNVWFPTNVTLDDLSLTPAQAKGIIERPITDNTTNRLVVTGTPLDEDDYRIKIEFYPAEDVTENLSVSSIGIWIPQGFTYDGDCNMETFAGTQGLYGETIEPCPGGEAIVWDFSAYPIPFTDLPPTDLDPGDFPQNAEITFKYESDDSSTRPNAIAWIVTAGTLSSDIPIAWDIDTRFYSITSIAGDTKVQAYASRSEMRNMYAATAGDYVAVGNSLMTDDDGDGYIRETWHSSSPASVSGMPDDAYISQAWLYWSGFFKSGFSAAFWGPDACSNMDNWEMSSQTQTPNADGTGSDISGTWTPSSGSTCFETVDDITPGDGDYMTGSTSGGYLLFNFPAFSIPAGSTIQDITVYVRAQRTGSNGSDIRPVIKVNGTRYYGSSNNPPNQPDWTTYSYSWTTNPNYGTSTPWSVSEIGGSGTRPLQMFGVYSSDCSPNVRVSMVYARVNYSCWNVYSGMFRGHYSSGTDSTRYLELKDAVNLSSYPVGDTIIEWEHYDGGTLEGDEDPVNRDRLQFQLSADNGASWSDPFTAFCDDVATSKVYYYSVIPEEYLTSGFKFRFYLDGFSGSGEYCYIDDIAIATITGSSDTTADFTVDGYDSHTETVNALESQLIGNKSKGQYSFACKADVTDLVKAHCDRNDSDDPIGNADYTVGNVLSDDGYVSWSEKYELAYCGWSLVIIYHSSNTAGRQLYLWDYFSYSKGNENLDFDKDGSPGGTITGFIVPERIGDEEEAAKLTCFVGEGDLKYHGDQLIFNGTPLWDGTTTEGNTEADPANVWNSASVGLTEDGVDIDTFSISWDSGLLHADDTQAQIDLETDTDNFNLIYIILSVRSETVVGGTRHYVISNE